MQDLHIPGPTKENPYPSSLVFTEMESPEEGCRKLADFLNLDTPVSKDVFISIVEDIEYANNVITCRRTPNFLNHLLNNPSRRWQAPENTETQQTQQHKRSNAALMLKAAQSLFTWSTSGIQQTSEQHYQQRLAACNACPHYIDAPNKLAYRAGALMAKNKAVKICNLCGCISVNKAKMVTESCPDKHPNRPGYTRWGEPAKPSTTNTM